ncbi:Fatty acyl-CoA reductase wat [Frankliniella fusca]|uniref:Fatty acyl-CoA reductase n=1 Tax=Frankliniella fusca TaxID=407009 RepID=A0AAE1HAA2_9NEOP|nr:Fatty acyl-CoA reductase wat [Frankliniella fusca]
MPPSQQITPPVAAENGVNLASRDLSSDLPSFYKGQNILLTGATGFMGKVLLEKLLYSCPDLGTVYLLIRTKKNQQPAQRLEAIFDCPVFARLREARPKFLHQVQAVAGDVGLPGLGLSIEDRLALIENVNIVLHCAATVRFDEALDLAVNINVRGTKCILDLAKEMKNLRSVVHVSTAYSNCPRGEIGEVIYEMPHDCDRVIQMMESIDGNAKVVEAVTPALLGAWPNSYSLTKALGESVVKKHRGALPVGIFRPSIVVNSAREPVAGWIDNLYGPGGVVLASGCGLMRVLNVNGKRVADMVPVDMACNALLAAAWETAIMTPEERAAEPDGLPIYNYVSSVDNPVTWNDFMSHTSSVGERYPVQQAVWIWCLTLCPSKLPYLFLVALLHFLPAIIVDIVCFAIGSKFRAIPVYKKIYKFSEVISYFGLREWRFKNHHTSNLWRRLSPKDKEMFLFDIKQLDWKKYLTDYAFGMRLYMFKENLDTAPRARVKRARFWWGHQIIRGLSAYLAVRLCWAALCWLAVGLVGRAELVAAVMEAS